MFKWQISPHRDGCEIRIELSWELIGKALRPLSAIVDALTYNLNEHGREVVERARQADEAKRRSRHNKEQFVQIGREVERRVRRLMADYQASGTNLPLIQQRRKACQELTFEFGHSAETLDTFSDLYRRGLKRRIRERHLSRLDRLYAEGLSDKDIARKLGVKVSRVKYLLQKYRSKASQNEGGRS